MVPASRTVGDGENGAVPNTPPPFRAEHVGSLLRPRRLKDAAKQGDGDYAEILDTEIESVVRMQEDVGLEAVTDGEFGRSSWFGFFFERLEGFGLAPSAFTFTDSENSSYEWQTAFTDAPIVRTEPIAVAEYERTSGLTAHVVKANLPAPSNLHFFRGDDCRDRAVYPDIEAWWGDVVAIYRAEIDDLYAAGCRYLQLDEVPLAMLCDPDIRAQVPDPDALVDRYVATNNEIVSARPADMTTAMHMCRGNFRSRWMAQGGYEPVAEQLFAGLDVDAFFLEYDSERAGGFEPLASVPADTHVVLGLVSTKTADLEDQDALRARIEHASTYIDIDRLSISPQCGFASVAGGNLLTEDEQRRKLELVVETAAKTWM